jgi:hypothetical protein
MGAAFARGGKIMSSEKLEGKPKIPRRHDFV